jgi:hypothetical protein
MTMRAPALAALAFLSGLGGLACATSRAVDPALDPDPQPCATDADCEVTGFTGCCACDGEPRGVNRAALAKRKDICAVVECACNGDCRCPPVADPRAFQAVCAQGRCAAARR